MNDVWIGIVCVAEPEGDDILDGSPGAYVHVLTIAESNGTYLKKVSAACEDVGLSVEEVLWSCSLQERLAEYDIEEYLKDLAADVAATKETRFGVFHGWEGHDSSSA